MESTSGDLIILLPIIFRLKKDINKTIIKFVAYKLLMMSYSRCLQLENVPSEIGYSKPCVQIAKIENDSPMIEFKNVEIKYSEKIEDKNVVDNVSFKIMKGEKICLLGKSGSGKSTIMKAICGCFEKYKGEILVKGHEISELNLQEMRTFMAIILQEGLIFESKLKTNLDPLKKISEEKLRKKLKKIGIWSILNERFQMTTILEESKMSGGEKQIVSIGRVLLGDKSLALFDESTSNVDKLTEKLVWDLVRVGFKDSTMLVISHRLENLDFYDRYSISLTFH